MCKTDSQRWVPSPRSGVCAGSRRHRGRAVCVGVGERGYMNMLHDVPLPPAQVCCSATVSRLPARGSLGGAGQWPHALPLPVLPLLLTPTAASLRAAVALDGTALGWTAPGGTGRKAPPVLCSSWAAAGAVAWAPPSPNSLLVAATHPLPSPILPYRGWVPANHKGSGRHLNKPRSRQQRQLLQWQPSARATSSVCPPLPSSTAPACATGIVGIAVLPQSVATLTLIWRVRY